MQVQVTFWVVADNGPKCWQKVLTHCGTRRACTQRVSQYANMLRITAEQQGCCQAGAKCHRCTGEAVCSVVVMLKYAATHALR